MLSERYKLDLRAAVSEEEYGFDARRSFPIAALFRSLFCIVSSKKLMYLSNLRADKIYEI